MFCSVPLCLSIKESNYVFFELRRGVCGGAWFICVFGQLAGKASKPYRKEKKYSIIKETVISSRNFQKTVRNSGIATHFTP